MRVVPAPDPVKIDGDLGDWDLSGWYLACPSEDVAQEMHGWLYAMYDQKNLYLAAEVADPSPMQNQASLALWREPWWGDDVEFRMVLKPEDPATKREIGVYYSEPAQRGEFFGNIPEGVFEKSQVVCHKWPDGKGYTLEVAIPWEALLSGFAPAPGQKITWTMGIIYGVPGKVTNYGVRAKACGDNSFFGTSGWGSAVFEPQGKLNRPKPALTRPVLRTVVPGAQKLFPIKYDLKQDSTVSLVICNEQGQIVRTLLNAVQRKAGHHDEPFDGLTDTDLAYGDNLGGPALPDGNYTWKLIASPLQKPVRLEHHMSFSGHGDPPWATKDQTGAWSSVYGYIQALCSDGKDLYALWSSAEVSPSLLKITPAGKKVWGAQPKGSAITTDGKHVYWANSLTIDDGKSCQVEIGRLDCERGLIAPFRSGAPAVRLGAAIDAALIRPPATERPEEEVLFDTLCPGLAVRQGRLYVSLRHEDRIAVLDANSGREFRSIPLAKPSGIAFGPDGKLYALTGRSLVAITPDGRQVTPVVTSDLEDPYGLAVDDAGDLWVSDRGRAQRVCHFAADGRRLAALGRYGGRPPAGKLDPVVGDLRQPAGLCTAFGRVYVAEDNLLNRVVIFDRSGRYLDHWQGYTNGNDSSFVDEQNPEYIYTPRIDGLIRWKLDYARRTWKVDAYSEGMLAGQRDRTFWHWAWRLHGNRYLEDFWPNGYRVHMHPRLIHSEGQTYMFSDGQLYYMAGPELFRVLALGGMYNWMWFPDSLVDQAQKRWPQLDLWTAAPGGHYSPKPRFWWRDNNRNGLMELDEYEVTSRADLGVNGGASYMAPDMRWYYAFDGYLWRWEPSGRDSAGLVTYRLDDLERLYPLRDTYWFVAESDGTVFAQPQIDSKDIGLGWASDVKYWRLERYAPDGKRLFSVGKKARSYAKPGEMYRSFGFASAPEDWPYVACIDESGQLLLYTKDGLFLTRLPEYDPYRGPEPNEKTMWIELFSANIFRAPGFREPLVRLSDLFRNSIFRLEGLDGLVRLTGTTQVEDAAVNQPAEAVSETAALGEPVTIARAEAPPALDGKAEGWPAMKSLQMAVDPSVEDQQAQVRLAYDDTNLYARFEVSDSSPLKNNADDLRMAFKKGDVCELFLGLDPEADLERNAPVAGDTRILLGNARGKDFAEVIQAVVPGAPEEAGFTYGSPVGSNHVDRAETITNAVVRTFVNPDGSGYVLEAAIPWQALGVAGPPAGTVKFDAGMEFGDVSGQFNAVHVSWAAGGPSGMVNDLFLESRLEPPRWGEARFGE